MNHLQNHKRKQISSSNYNQNEYDVDQGQFVDDLAIAAQFANVTSPDSPSLSTSSSSDDDDDQDCNASPEKHSSSTTLPTIESQEEFIVENKEQEEEDIAYDPQSTASKHEGNHFHDNNNNNYDDDDDESDIDLTEQLAKMEEYDSNDEYQNNNHNTQKHNKQKSNKSNNSKSLNSASTVTTTNEIDVYNCPLVDLQSQFDIDLNLDQTSNSKNPDSMNGSDDTISYVKVDSLGGVWSLIGLESHKLHTAGFIKCHLIPERTVVVESSSLSSIYNNVNTRNFQSTLDEGTLLLFQIPTSMTVKQDSSFPNNEHDCDNNNNVNSGSLDTQQKVGFSYIILGKILEVFGPVSKPLYTVRLQEWNTRVNDENNVKNDINNDGSNTDESKKVVEETSLFGDESEVDNEHNLKEKSSSHEKTELNKDEESMENESQLNSPSDSKVSLKNSESDHPDLNKNNSLLNPSEHIEKNEIKAKNLDPWSPPGILTNFIKNNEKVQVYYLDGQVKLVDTQAVVRNSGKGCDASNVYDEEIDDANEMYFSDDEQERLYKQNRKSKKGNTQQIGKSHDINNSMIGGGLNQHSTRGRGGRGTGRGRDRIGSRGAQGTAHHMNPNFIPASFSPGNAIYPPTQPPLMWQYQQQQPQVPPPPIYSYNNLSFQHSASHLTQPNPGVQQYQYQQQQYQNYQQPYVVGGNMHYPSIPPPPPPLPPPYVLPTQSQIPVEQSGSSNNQIPKSNENDGDTVYYKY